MARIYIQDEPIDGCGDSKRHIDDADDIRAFLQPFGIWHEQWDVAGRLGTAPTDEEILVAYAPEIDRLKATGSFITADVINVRPDIPNLEAMLQKFRSEHTHRDDEVRFIVQGAGVFHIHGNAGQPDARVFAIQVEAGDLINVPAGTRHWFDLCQDRQIRAIRLFIDPSGWVPEYVDAGVHAGYQPLCFGPAYLPPPGALASPLPELGGRLSPAQARG